MKERIASLTRSVRAAIVAAVVLALIGSIAVSRAWADGQPAESSGPSKNEIVYAKTDAEGATNGVYVVNFFDTPDAEDVVDPAAYESVENLSTTDELSQEGGAVHLTTTAGKPFYYQGTMDAQTKLPWKVSVSYELDGKPVSAQDVAGASGDLAMTLSITPDETSEDLSDFTQNYLVQAQGTFPSDKFSVSDAGDATMAQSGDNTVATCLVLPGESGTFTLRGTASDFETSGWQISALPLSLSVDLASQDTSELSASTDELQSAILSASDGSDGVSSGAGSVASGATDLSDGLAQLDGSSASLEAGWRQMAQGIDDASSGADSLAAGSAQFKDQVASSKADVAGGASQLDGVKATYQAAMQQVMTEQAQGAVTQESLAALNDAATALSQASSAAGAYQALDDVEDGYGRIDEGISSLSGGLSDLSGGSASFGEGLSSYTSGVGSAASGSNELAQGAAELAGGSDELSSGLAQLAESTSGLDQKIIDQLQEKIDEKLGADFKPHSFVVPSNTNVGAVQFVYVVDGVSTEQPKSDDAASSATDESDTTFFDRLAAVFGL